MLLKRCVEGIASERFGSVQSALDTDVEVPGSDTAVEQIKEGVLHPALFGWRWTNVTLLLSCFVIFKKKIIK